MTQVSEAGWSPTMDGGKCFSHRGPPFPLGSVRLSESMWMGARGLEGTQMRKGLWVKGD